MEEGATLRDAFDGHARRALARLPAVQGAVEPGLRWAEEVGRWAPAPGSGSTRRLWEFFVEVAAVDVAVARIMEPHLDARAILRQAPAPIELGVIGVGPDSTWGVFAAEAPGAVLAAAQGKTGRWLLDGVKPWCSLAGSLSHALVTASLEDGRRRLFAVALGASGVHADTGPWFPRGLAQIVSAPVHFDQVPAIAVGEPGWYLERPGFAWGGIGVAACWLGGAVGIARTLLASARRREPDQLALAHLGAIDAALAAARTTIATAADVVDDPQAAGIPWPVLMLRARNIAAAAAEEVLERVAHALGPAPLALDEHHARRVADLQLYVRQHHAERDAAALGRAVLETGERPW